MNRGVRHFAVQTRCIGGPIYTVELDAEDSFLAHRQIQTLFPDRTVIRIVEVPKYRDGQDG